MMALRSPYLLLALAGVPLVGAIVAYRWPWRGDDLAAVRQRVMKLEQQAQLACSGRWALRIF